MNSVSRRVSSLWNHQKSIKVCFDCLTGLLSSVEFEDPDYQRVREAPPLACDTSQGHEDYIRYYQGSDQVEENYVKMNVKNKEISNEKNKTFVTEFLLLGFQVSHGKRLFLFCLFLLVYFMIICGNLLITTLVSTSKNLHTPMYFFILQLSISDILLPSDIVPNLLHILLNNGGSMTFVDCISQCYFFGALETFECLLLAVMSYDRYVAICNPLRYTSIMTRGHCVILTIFSFLFGLSLIFIYTITIANLSFCGDNIIDHLFCDFVPLIDLSCSETFAIHLEIYLLGTPSVFIPVTIIVVSYTYIVVTVFRIPSSTGRQKAFSTCSSHLTVVSIFYGTLFSIYVVPSKGLTLTVSKILSLLYTVFTPFINPIIYSLRNEDIKKAIQGTVHKLVI
ncbi:olfactory receptor 5G9-like [Ranitomeya variabilis]|uniref:olfactory receptor 5G9-like n=1 Tax=Ranitomeya variabilis TaxID=490064 RepID=UPI0040562C8A